MASKAEPRRGDQEIVPSSLHRFYIEILSSTEYSSERFRLLLNGHTEKKKYKNYNFENYSLKKAFEMCRNYILSKSIGRNYTFEKYKLL